MKKEKNCTCGARCALLFLLGVLVGAVLAGLLFFYEVLKPMHYETSTFRDYSISQPKVDLHDVKVAEPIGDKIDLQAIGGGWGGLVR